MTDKNIGIVKMIKSFLKLALAATVLIVSTGCGTTKNPTRADTESLSDLRNMTRTNTATIELSGIRFAAIRDTALSLGARGGLAWRAKQINADIDQYTRPLERIFNFNAMMLPDSVLPPVLLEGRNTLEQTSEDTLRIADRSYIIQSQAKFVTAPPTWRDYLKLYYNKPEVPDRSLLPKTEQEHAVWDKFIQQGWQAGILQADTIFAENMGRLKRDYTGMIRYRSLLAQGIVSPPFVAKVDLGITGSSNEMTVNDRVLRITVMPAFQADPEHWKSEITPLS